MKWSTFLAIGSAIAWPTRRPYTTWMADTFIDMGVESDFGYQDAVLYLGFERAYELSGDRKYFDWYRNQIENQIVLNNGSIRDWNFTRKVLDEYRMGHNYLYLYDQTGEEKYKSAADIVRYMLDIYPRNPSGGFWHQEQFPNQMWLDGIYMADSFYAKWTHRYDRHNKTAWDDILNQYELIEKHAHFEDSPLLVHGWADGYAPWADPKTGKSPHVWGRAQGWYFWSLTETLQVFPKLHPGYWKLLKAFKSLSAGLKEARDSDTCSWEQVLDEEYRGAEGNFVEASASAMYTYGIMKGIRLGFLSAHEYLDFAKDSYKGLVDNFVVVSKNGTLNYNGTVEECNLADGGVDYEYYITRPIVNNGQNGCGPFMMASYEWETWVKKA